MNEDFPWSHPVLNQYILHIGSIPRNCNRADIEEFLQSFGEIAWLKVYKTRPPATRYAHAIFTRVQSYFDLLNLPEHFIGDDKLRLSMWRKTPLSCQFSDQLDRRKVFIKNLSTRLRIESVRKALSKYGLVVHLDGLFDSDNQKFRNIAFAVFATETEAQYCLQNKQQIREEKGFKIRPYKLSQDSSLVPGLSEESGFEEPSKNESSEGRDKQLVQRASLVPFVEYLNKHEANDGLRKEVSARDDKATVISPDGRPKSPHRTLSASLESAPRPKPKAQIPRIAPPSSLQESLKSHQASLNLPVPEFWPPSILSEKDEQCRQIQPGVQVFAGLFEVGSQSFTSRAAQSPQSGLINRPEDGWNTFQSLTRQVRITFYTVPGGI